MTEVNNVKSDSLLFIFGLYLSRSQTAPFECFTQKNRKSKMQKKGNRFEKKARAFHFIVCFPYGIALSGSKRMC